MPSLSPHTMTRLALVAQTSAVQHATHPSPITYLQAIILGLLQGVSELFPISSLGHAVLFPELFGWHNLVASESQPESFNHKITETGENLSRGVHFSAAC